MQQNLPEAERRIEEARRTRAEGLDLGDLALSELPASLGDLPHLKTLSLGTPLCSTRQGTSMRRLLRIPPLVDLGTAKLFRASILKGISR